MPIVKYVLTNGSERAVEVAKGASVMQGAVQNGIREILADCGGGCACATCHVYVDPEFEDRLPPKSDIEDELLDGVAAERRSNSRLSCQLTMDASLDGLVVRLPERQF